MNIDQLCKDSHEISKEKGWLDEKRSFAACCALIHSELSEALEEYRANKPLNLTYFTYKDEAGRTQTTEGLKDDAPIEKYKPEGIPIELADVLIRIAQHCGTEDLNLAGVVAGILNDVKDFSKVLAVHKDFERTLMLCHSDISLAYLASIRQLPELMPPIPLHYFAMCWISIDAFCRANGIDIDAAVKLKQEYNKTRSHKHGGKKI